MSDSFSTAGGNIVANRGGVEKFSTAKPQFRRVPQGTLLLGSGISPYTITFPDMDKGYNYYWATYAGSHGTAEQCVVGQKLVGQEWGPSGLGFTSPHLLPDIDVGPAPDGCDYLDVQVNLARTTSPTDTVLAAAGFLLPIYGTFPWPLEIEESQWLTLTDQALVVEKTVGFSRMFWFEVVSGRILLRRKQSVVSVDSAGTLVPNDGKIGWEYGFVAQGTVTPTSYPVAKTNDPGTNSLGPTHVNGSGCSAVASLDATSVYSGQIIIVPCCTVTT